MVRCPNCDKKDLEEADTEDGVTAYLCPNASKFERGVGCHTLISKEDHDDLREQQKSSAASSPALAQPKKRSPAPLRAASSRNLSSPATPVRPPTTARSGASPSSSSSSSSLSATLSSPASGARPPASAPAVPMDADRIAATPSSSTSAPPASATSAAPSENGGGGAIDAKHSNPTANGADTKEAETTADQEEEEGEGGDGEEEDSSASGSEEESDASEDETASARKKKAAAPKGKRTAPSKPAAAAQSSKSSSAAAPALGVRRRLGGSKPKPSDEMQFSQENNVRALTSGIGYAAPHHLLSPPPHLPPPPMTYCVAAQIGGASRSAARFAAFCEGSRSGLSKHARSSPPLPPTRSHRQKCRSAATRKGTSPCLALAAVPALQVPSGCVFVSALQVGRRLGMRNIGRFVNAPFKLGIPRARSNLSPSIRNIFVAHSLRCCLLQWKDRRRKRRSRNRFPSRRLRFRTRKRSRNQTRSFCGSPHPSLVLQETRVPSARASSP
jgi:hypothetical protein